MAITARSLTEMAGESEIADTMMQIASIATQV
jgi:hypothetical protein